MSNAEGVAILEAAVAHDLIVCNTGFKKRQKHLITESKHGRSQIDLFMVKREDKGNCKNCRVVSRECGEGQHKLVVVDMQ